MRRTLYASVLLAYFACDGTVEASPRKSSLIDSKHNPYSMHDDPGVEIPKRQRAPWLSLPFVIKGNGKGIGRKAWRIPSFEIVNDERFKEALASTLTYGKYLVIVSLALGCVGAFLDAVKDIGDLGDLDSGRKGASSRKIINWLRKYPEERGPPPKVSPSWMLPLTLQLLESSELTYVEVERILSQISKSQAATLQTCLLRRDESINFQSIGGLSSVKQSIYDWITAKSQPSTMEGTPYDHFVNQGRNGVVLWGPPGCGKSLLIQAIARKARLPTLVVTPSLIQSKWFGDSTNKVRDFFGLVSIIGPCIVVLDEIDGLFRVRSQDEHETSRDLKTEWLQWWDGVASAQMESNRIMVIAATNRPWDVDPGVWRRLPQRFYVGVPTYDERLSLIELWMNKYQLPVIDLSVIEYFAKNTEGYTPSDLQQVLQTACRKGPMARRDTELTIEDVRHGLNEIPAMRFSMQYIQQLQNFLQPTSLSKNKSSEGTVPYSPPNANDFDWQMQEGNYYHFPVPVDAAFLDALENFLWKEQDWDSSDFDEYEEESDSDDGL